MVLTGRPPYVVDQEITTPALAISLGDATFSPVGAVDDLVRRLFWSTSVTRRRHTGDQVPEGSTRDHIGWVHTPVTVVDRIVTWWHGTPRN
ncbi:hypothetical protein [Streptomyces sp. TLI_55]|uniref:hypothetical protein n=1 Tax=Streptomyces sp. TLI_55 TaxID=1938861 RepID=UPI000BE3C613|nr:hypothetical protein [Streptomyces sp. TLI_55]